MKTWVMENLLLILTFSGVVTGERKNIFPKQIVQNNIFRSSAGTGAPVLPAGRVLHRHDRVPGRAVHEAPQAHDPPPGHRQPHRRVCQPQR